MVVDNINLLNSKIKCGGRKIKYDYLVGGICIFF